MMTRHAILTKWLRHPLAAGTDIDDPGLIAVRKGIIRQKGFLRRIYEEWYAGIVKELPGGEGSVLEIGSGPGFLSDFVPGLITSECVFCDIDCVCDAHRLPFAARSLRGILMTNVFHHLPYPGQFLSEASRCVRPGGVVSMIEPWVSPWSRLIYGRLHHEPFDPDAQQWTFPSRGPLSSANGAQPWIVFRRDRVRFEKEFPEWEIRSVDPIMPFVYLLSGGVAWRGLAPSETYRFCRAIEDVFLPWWGSLAMFAKIVLVKGQG
jgi:SAM-dependent methyltransferase